MLSIRFSNCFRICTLLLSKHAISPLVQRRLSHKALCKISAKLTSQYLDVHLPPIAMICSSLMVMTLSAPRRIFTASYSPKIVMSCVDSKVGAYIFTFDDIINKKSFFSLTFQMFHIKARGPHPQYPKRYEVSEQMVSWAVPTEYTPIDFTHSIVHENIGKWADLSWKDMNVAQHDEVLSRITYATGGRAKTLKAAKFVLCGKPQNPIGRTGMKGRGLLGKYGPNHAADPIVTRFNPSTGKLEMVAILRKDTGEKAIPGGMVEGDTVPETLKKEFKEEALRHEDNLLLSSKILTEMDALFKHGGEMIYRGYVDDPRNTDNAWMETQCHHIHIYDKHLAEALPLQGGDDATHAMWIDITDPCLSLYASHKRWVDKVVNKMKFKTRLRLYSR